MSTTPEEFLGQEGFLAFAEPGPFSPSVFLDLPPTPRPDGGKEPDDLVLPFISRMLVEEDIDDKFFYQYPDHPALLAAQEPFAKILSGATTSSDSATTKTDGSGNPALSPSSSADAAWQYNPIELFQSLSHPDLGLDDLNTDDVGAFFLPVQDQDVGVQQSSSRLAGNAGNASAFFAGHHDGSTGVHSSVFLNQADEEHKKKTTTLPAGDGYHATPASSYLSGPKGESMNMDMFSFNQAFLQGMEEAKKFLPTNNSLLMDLEATSGKHQLSNSNMSSGFPSSQVKKDGVPMFNTNGNCRGKKNRYNWYDLEVEMGRNNKMMVPEPEETGEMVDNIIFNGLDLCLEKMKGLRIVMDSEAEKNTRKRNVQSAHGRQRTNDAVDLHSLLIHCAQAVATDSRRSAIELLMQIKQHSSPRGDATQRLAHCFAEGLEARLAGTGSQVYRSLMAKRTSVVEFLKAHQLYLAACCFKMMAFKFSNITIGNAIAGRKKVHIVDYGIGYGIQWPSLLGHLAAQEGGAPEVRITGIDLPQPGFHPGARIEETGRRLSNCARQFGVPFKFHSITSKWETVRVADLNIDPEEVLIVNSIVQFGSLMDEGVDIDSPNPRDVVLNNIQKMRPDAFILFVMNGSHSVPFFVTRFREALFYYSAMFDMLDATAPRDNDQRLLVERDLFGRCILNVIACEGSDRVERPETYKQWQVRNHRAGLRQLPLDPGVVKVVKDKVKEQFHNDFVIDVDHQWLLEGWKGRILYAMSTWVADDAFSQF